MLVAEKECDYRYLNVFHCTVLLLFIHLQ